MTGRKSRNKGARGENELAQILNDHWGTKAKRKLGQARDSGDDLEIQPFRIEVKRRETIAITAWCEQVEAAAQPGEIPVVAFRRNNEPWRVTMRLEDFIKLGREEVAKEIFK